jgi:hypothetical protein
MQSVVLTTVQRLIALYELLQSVGHAVVVEEYPHFRKGPCVLVLQEDRKKLPVHVVWGIAQGTHTPAVLVTAYRPDPEKWEDNFTRRKR